MRYVPPLDGLRAVAALSVFAYHSRIAPGGFLGVDLFFPISGFLITTTLLADRAQSGRIHFGAFYLRRARRLLPGLFVLLALAYVTWPPTGPPYGPPARAALFYYANWKHALSGADSLGHLTHTWSLSIEEQFYAFWPWALTLILWAVPNRRRAGWCTLALAALFATVRAFAAWHGSVLAGYGSTLARIDELLIGAAFALIPVAERGQRSALRHWVGVAFLASYTVLTTAVRAEWTGRWLFLGGFTLVALFASILVRDLSENPGSALGKLLAWRPLVEVGKRSYGVYLFHYPIIHWGGRIWGGGRVMYALETLIRLAATLAIAWLSYRFIEAPFLARRHRSLASTQGAAPSHGEQGLDSPALGERRAGDHGPSPGGL